MFAKIDPLLSGWSPKTNFSLVRKIISGGQTGVDRAALDIAIKYGIAHGGWCPMGRLAEDGTIPLFYTLWETSTPDYAQRTQQNIITADATLILVPTIPLPSHISDGTILTIEFCQKNNKLHLIIDLSAQANFDEIKKWLQHNKIHTLNIAGPRQSQSDGIYNLAYRYLQDLLILA